MSSKIRMYLKQEKIYLFFVAHLVFLAISTIVSKEFYVSVGVFIINLVCFFVFTASRTVMGNDLIFKRFLQLILLIVTILSIISFINTIFFRYVNYETEGLSYMWIYWGHNHLAVLLLIAIPINILLLRICTGLRTRVGLSFLLIFLLYSMLITFSRGGLLALLFEVVLMSFYILRSSSLKTPLLISLSFLVLMPVLMLFHVASQKKVTGVEARFYHLERGKEIFLSRPILGAGPGSYSFYNIENSPSKSSFAHNSIVQNLSEVGLLGTLVFLIILVIILKEAAIKVLNKSRSERGYIGAVLSIIIISLLLNDLWDFDLYIPSFLIVFWILVGALFSRNEI